MPLVFRWLGATTNPVGGEVIRPDQLIGSRAELARQPVRVGTGSAALGDLFAFEGDGDDGSLIVLEGDLRTVHGLGAGMERGTLRVRGDVGHRLGIGMTGGTIEVGGSAGVGAGAELAGGTIRIDGNAGDDLGAALPGSRVGMRGGVILVRGQAGAGVGTAMRRGVIAVGGSVGPGAGRGLIAGSIFGGGEVGLGVGLGMKRGTIGVWGVPDDWDPGPTFEPAGRFPPPVVAIYRRQLQDWGFPVPAEAGRGRFRRYNGDRGIGGQGEIWHLGPS